MIAPFVTLIHSVDSQRLLGEIQRQALKYDRVIDVLLELHVAQEATKSGFTIDECTAFLEAFRKEDYPNVRICGLMTMASNVDDNEKIEGEFRLVADYFDYVKEHFFASEDYFKERSWGMSDDYLLALRHRSTLVRIGTKIFGERK